MTKRRDYHFCPICGAALDTGEKCDECELLQAKASKIGYSIRAKYRCKGVFEILNLPAVPDGDTRLQALNMIDSKLAAEYQLNRKPDNRLKDGADDE